MGSLGLARVVSRCIGVYLGLVFGLALGLVYVGLRFLQGFLMVRFRVYLGLT